MGASRASLVSSTRFRRAREAKRPLGEGGSASGDPPSLRQARLVNSSASGLMSTPKRVLQRFLDVGQLFRTQVQRRRHRGQYMSKGFARLMIIDLSDFVLDCLQTSPYRSDGLTQCRAQAARPDYLPSDLRERKLEDIGGRAHRFSGTFKHSKILIHRRSRILRTANMSMVPPVHQAARTVVRKFSTSSLSFALSFDSV